LTGHIGEDSLVFHLFHLHHTDSSVRRPSFDNSRLFDRHFVAQLALAVAEPVAATRH
jgi:hypothetical protein